MISLLITMLYKSSFYLSMQAFNMRENMEKFKTNRFPGVALAPRKRKKGAIEGWTISGRTRE